MESQGVNIVVIEGNKIEKTLKLQQTEGSKPVTLDAVENGKYMLAEDGNGFAPENITVKRVGDDLYISLEGEDTDHPQLIIRDYYLNEGELVGKGEDGAYYSYVTAYGQDSAALTGDAAQPMALGSDSIPDFAAGLVVDDSNHELMWALAGLGLLALAGGAVALANHHHHHDDKVSSTPDPSNGGSGGDDNGNGGDTPVAPVVKSGTLDAIIDDVGSKQGPIENGASTDDNKPTFNGSGVEPGNTVVITDTDGTAIGSTTADENGNWSFTPDSPITDGAHDISVIVIDGDGNKSEPSNDINVVIDTVAPAATDVTASDTDGNDIKGGDTNDNTPTFSGDDAEPNSTVIIYDGDDAIGSATVDDNGEWNFTPDTPLDDGNHDINVVVIDDAGNESVPSEDIPFTIDTVAPDAATDLLLMDDVGDEQGPINEGDTTDDNTPTFSGEAEANAMVIISDKGEVIGTAVTDENGSWSFTPDALDEGDHSFSTVVEDAAGNKSSESTPIDFTVDTSTIPATSGSENFEAATEHYFKVAGDSVTLDSGLSITFVSGPTDGAGINAYTGISSDGIYYYGPASFGTEALLLVEDSVTKLEFGGGTDTVSFDVNASSFEGSTVTYYDNSGKPIHSEALPVEADDEVQTITWTAPAGEKIGSMTLETGDGQGSNVITRVDNFSWGPALESAPALEATHDVAATHHDAGETALTLNYDAFSQPQADAHQQEGIINVQGHQTLSLDELLSHATTDLMIADGKEQVAITGDTNSSVELDLSHDAQNWDNAGQVTAGGVVYDVYQQQNNLVELLIQHGIEVQHG
ncbi:Ig-like domain-containing protein [Scandinavium sp. NPDC088450]|uniref:Ig-like domain-containing protein n=1 Tax=Scandinavium sp. NPDC088450 TaxID=3364514 RepID=UPI00384E7F24